MTQQEYEQKKAECWKKCAAEVAVETENLLCKAIAYSAFDRAYALGKQKETITQEDVENTWQDYAKEIGLPESLNYATRSMIEIAIKQAFKAGANFSLGKQEKNDDTVIVDIEEYDKLCKRSRYIANWVPYFRVCPICGEYNPIGCICANCDNNKDWNK